MAEAGCQKSEPSAAPSLVREVLRSPGQPLDPATRNFMEPRFGHDFGRVRVHTDGRAAESARAVSARAYTVGDDVVFGANKYAPASQEGRGLLAHELAHTIQQRQPAGPPPAAEPNGVLELSANKAARDVSEGKGVSTDLPGTGVGLARAPDADADRAAAEADALAYLAQVKKEEEEEKKKDRKEEEENVTSISMTLGGKKPVRKRPPPKAAPRAPWEGEYERLTAPLFAEMAENNKQLDAEYASEAEIVKKPYKKRLAEVRNTLVRQSSFFHDRKKAERLMTAEEVWLYGMNNGLFVEREKKFVYEDQNALHEYIREQQEERAKQARAEFQTKQYNEHVARGKQLSAPGPIVTSFALPGLGPVGLAFGGAQTGMMVGDAINKCRSGTAGDCAAAVAPAVAVAVAHRITLGGGPKVQTTPTPPPGSPPIPFGRAHPLARTSPRSAFDDTVPGPPPGPSTQVTTPPPAGGGAGRGQRTLQGNPPPVPKPYQPPAPRPDIPWLPRQNGVPVGPDDVQRIIAIDPTRITWSFHKGHNASEWGLVSRPGAGLPPLAFTMGGKVRVDYYRWKAMGLPEPRIPVR